MKLVLYCLAEILQGRKCSYNIRNNLPNNTDVLDNKLPNARNIGKSDWKTIYPRIFP